MRRKATVSDAFQEFWSYHKAPRKSLQKGDLCMHDLAGGSQMQGVGFTWRACLLRLPSLAWPSFWAPCSKDELGPGVLCARAYLSRQRLASGKYARHQCEDEICRASSESSDRLNSNADSAAEDTRCARVALRIISISVSMAEEGLLHSGIIKSGDLTWSSSCKCQFGGKTLGGQVA